MFLFDFINVFSFVKWHQDTAVFPRHVVRLHLINLVSFLEISTLLVILLFCQGGCGMKKKIVCMSVETFQCTQRFFSSTALLLYFCGHWMNWPSKVFTCCKTRKALKYRCVCCFWGWVMASFAVSAISFLENVNIRHFLPIQPALFH